MSDLDLVLSFVTVPAMLTAIASGLGLAFATWRLQPGADPHLAGFVVIVAGILWYLPQAVERWAGAGAYPDGAGIRTLGALAVYVFAFALPAGLAFALLQRRGKP